MTTHLSNQEFVDAVDLVLASDRVAHLTVCAACRAEVEALRAVLADVSQGGDVPEPSPLFWDHFQSRVRAEVQSEAAVPARLSWWATLGSARTFLAAGATVAAAVIAVSLYTGGSVEPGSSAAVSVGETSELLGPEDGFAGLDGVEWGFVTDVMETLGPDEARDVLVPTRHAMDAAFESLTTAERDAFVRLLTAEMAEGLE